MLIAPHVSSEICILISPSFAYGNALGMSVAPECCASHARKTAPFWPLFAPSCFKDNNSLKERKQNLRGKQKVTANHKENMKVKNSSSFLDSAFGTQQILMKAVKKRGRTNGHHIPSRCSKQR